MAESQRSDDTGHDQGAFISRAGCLQGALLCFPAIPAIAGFGITFGTVAAQKGLTFLETLLINSMVFAGASQFVAMELYRDPMTWGTLLAMTGVTAAVNLRMVLIGASLRPWMGGAPAYQTYPSLFFLTDLNWLIALREYDKGTRDWGVFLGGGLFAYAIWFASVIPGYMIGSMIANPKDWGLDVILPCFFIALLVPVWKGKRQTISWAAAAVAAVVTWSLVGGYWCIVTGALAGAFAGAYADD